MHSPQDKLVQVAREHGRADYVEPLVGLERSPGEIVQQSGNLLSMVHHRRTVPAELDAEVGDCVPRAKRRNGITVGEQQRSSMDKNLAVASPLNR